MVRKLFLVPCVLACTVSLAQAGGYSAPAVEAEPVVVEQSSSSNPGIIIPILLLLAVVAASNSGSGSSTSTPD